MLETIQKLVPWVSGLPFAPKAAITGVWLLLSFVLFYSVWVPPRKAPVEEKPVVKAAYDRMDRVLRRIRREPNGQVLVDGKPVEAILAQYYVDYAAMGEFVANHPGDTKGAYEEIWARGGASRTFINDTQAFEAVVSEFFQQYRMASAGG